jgi:signal transduction histidine kinase
MKLFTKYSRINLLATIIIFLIASTAFYFTLRLVFISQIDEDLKIEEKEIETYVKEHDQLPESISVNDQLISYKPASDPAKRYFTTRMMNENVHEREKFRQLVFTIKAGNQWYQAIVSKSLEETETLTRSILVIVFTTILVILLVSFVINRFVLKRIWKPFYQSLNAFGDFKVGANRPLSLPRSTIDEFQLMNTTLEKISSRAALDYLSLRTFSENASHEIQTPLAVIRSRLDLMIQDESLSEKQTEALQAVFNSVQKLTKLNKSLLLLVKIENDQFYEKKELCLDKKIKEKIADFNELWNAHDLTLQREIQQVTVLMNEELLEILLNNLLSNATKHNFSGGKINIVLNNDYLMVSNTSHAPALNSDSLYQRFARLSNENDSTGLGLSIIKEICDTSSFKIDYGFHNDQHAFIINWKS